MPRTTQFRFRVGQPTALTRRNRKEKNSLPVCIYKTEVVLSSRNTPVSQPRLLSLCTKMARRGVICLLLVTLTLDGGQCNTRYFIKMKTNASELFKTRGENSRMLQDPIAATLSPLHERTKINTEDEDSRTMKEYSSTQTDRRNSFLETSTFNPDVLNKFLEEYASKIKSTTMKNPTYPYRVPRPTSEPILLEMETQTTNPSTLNYEQDVKLEETVTNSAINEEELSEALNDTLKRNKYYGTNSYEDRNGWVTLEAIPWSKSKISKWQANPSTQRPWPEIKPWDKPSIAKPWSSDYSVRPIYDNNKPWYEKPKPNWPENNNDKPWQKLTTRPSYYSDKHDEPPSQAQKWPPERPSWNKYTDSHRPNSDIITDDRPSDFPNNWNRPQSTKPSYQFIDRYSPDKSPSDDNDWHDFPSRYEQMNDRLRLTTERPNFSHYQYVNNHPPTYPANGDGQWVLLSTNRGYSKTRQRSIKIDTLNPQPNGTRRKEKEQPDPAVPVMTSKRQVDGVTVDQRHEHDHVPRGSPGSRENIQERRTEPEGIRARETNDGTDDLKETTDQKYPVISAIGIGSSGSRRRRHVTSNHGDDDTNDARPSKTRLNQVWIKST